MRDDVALPESALRWRLLVGTRADGRWARGRLPRGLHRHRPLGVLRRRRCASALLLGVALTSPVIGRPVIAACGCVYRRLFGTVGVMAEQNAIRNPRRTAATASALMIGLTLVSMMSVFGASAKASVDKSIDAELRGRLRRVQRDRPAVLADDHQGRRGQGARASRRSTPVRYTGVQDGRRPQFAAAVDPATFGRGRADRGHERARLGAHRQHGHARRDKAAKELGSASVTPSRPSSPAGKEGTYTRGRDLQLMEAMAIPVLISLATATAHGGRSRTA